MVDACQVFPLAHAPPLQRRIMFVRCAPLMRCTLVAFLNIRNLMEPLIELIGWLRDWLDHGLKRRHRRWSEGRQSSVEDGFNGGGVFYKGKIIFFLFFRLRAAAH